MNFSREKKKKKATDSGNSGNPIERDLYKQIS